MFVLKHLIKIQNIKKIKKNDINNDFNKINLTKKILSKFLKSKKKLKYFEK